jgi:MFS family permease
VTERPSDRSYRALLAVPGLPRMILAMLLSRVAQSMVSVALVLFTLREYDSAVLAGVVTFTSIFPGLLVAPIAGALLDRHGRVRLVMLDYAVALAAFLLIGALALVGSLPPWLLVAITAISSLTSILSVTGLRSLFPLVVPEPLWERANAVDSNGYVVATILGPPLAAGLVSVAGGPVALIATGLLFGLAAVAMIGLPDPETDTAATGNLLLDAWQGLVYSWRNRTLRGLAFAISTLNIAGGISTILVPVLVLQYLGYPESAVGIVFAVSGITGMISALAFGRMDTRGQEWRLLVVPMILSAGAAALLLPVALAGQLHLEPAAGLLVLALAMALVGLVTGPMDIAMFTIRQRRTDPAWMGRAFAVSMALNFTGYPVGAALGGFVATSSPALAVAIAVAASLLAGLIAAWLIPREEGEADSRSTDPIPVA